MTDRTATFTHVAAVAIPVTDQDRTKPRYEGPTGIDTGIRLATTDARAAHGAVPAGPRRR